MDEKTNRSQTTGKVLAFPSLPKPAVRVELWDAPRRPTEDLLRERLAADGYQAMKWSNEPATGYPPHVHVYPELLWMVSGSLTVLLPGENRMFELMPGDRIEVPRGIAHGTMAGPDGAVYLVATR